MKRSSGDIILDTLPEAVFQQQVEDYAKVMGYLTYHTWNSQKSTPGFPDLFLVKMPRIVIAELKTMTGEPSLEQLEWLEQIQHCPCVECYLWRPNDWAEIYQVLT